MNHAFQFVKYLRGLFFRKKEEPWVWIEPEQLFKYELCYTQALPPQWGPDHFMRAQMINGISTWCKDTLERNTFTVGFEDYGQHGEYMLRTDSEEDLLAFKLRWAV